MKYNTKQVQALIAKYRMENDISTLIELGTAYPPFQPVVRDIVTSYISKKNKVSKRLERAGLSSFIQ